MSEAQAKAQTLRARIDEIDIQLRTQLPKQLLKKLENEKSNAQRQLNELVDPIAGLPIEISSEIFLQTFLPSPEPHVGLAPLLLLRVCNTWADIAVSTPALWTSIRIYFPCAKSFRKWILPAWLDRARNRPLSVSFVGDLRYWNYRVSAMIWQRAGQLKHLKIRNEDVKGDDKELFLVDIFGDRSPPGCMPLLETLTVRDFGGKRAFSGRQILDLLGRMPNIIEFRTDPQYRLPPEELIIVVPSLRRLLFGSDEEWYDEILNYLSLPALETLAVSLYSSADLHRLMIRSAPPLQDLEICWTWNSESSSIHLLEFLHIIPTLCRFRVVWPNQSVVQDLFAGLADYPCLLPNLHSLLIHAQSDLEDDNYGTITILEASWKTLVRALSTRHNQLRVFALEPVKMPLASDVLAALNELVVDGMQTYIGNEESNFAAAGFSLEAPRYDNRWWEWLTGGTV